MKEIKIAVATHKKFRMPSEEMYLPVQSGAALHAENLGYSKDDVGDNISQKNQNFCELTALYWLWKNAEGEYKGLVHYRRYFSNKKFVNMFATGKFEDVLTKKALSKKLEKYDVILPTKRHYYIESIESHYKHTHHEQDLAVTKEIISRQCPEYLASYQTILNSKSAHMFNMFIMKDEYFTQYCAWLFAILFELEKKLDISDYSPFHARVFGRVSEVLLDVWIKHNHIHYAEVPVMFMEHQDWGNKISKFLKAKMKNEKY